MKLIKEASDNGLSSLLKQLSVTTDMIALLQEECLSHSHTWLLKDVLKGRLRACKEYKEQLRGEVLALLREIEV